MSSNRMRNERYACDPEFAYRIKEHNRKFRGSVKGEPKPPKKRTYTASEVCNLLNIHVSTLDKYQKLGLIPRTTYPSRHRVYWVHQVLALSKLFYKMRDQGWPRVPPRYHGSKEWSVFIEKIRILWNKDITYGKESNRKT